MNRKRFLEVAVTGGLGMALGGSALNPGGWREHGVKIHPVRRSSLVMGSVITMEVLGESERDGEEAIRRALDCFRDLDRKLSMYKPDSEMGALSRNAGGKPVSLSDDAMAVLAFAKKIYGRSGRRFDVTIEPAMRAWGFRGDPSEKVERPTDRELRALERVVGFEKVELGDGQARLPEPGMAIDLGGIAGGYALDRAIERMKKMDVKAALINFSGDIHCFCNPTGKEGWPVRIYNPVTGRPLADPVILRESALSTSGSYRNRRGNGSDQSWGHLLMPGSVTPVEPVRSLTAIHESAMAADAWSTAGYLGADLPEEVDTVVI